MFTAAVFKDLLLPLFDKVKKDFVFLPLKKTVDFNFCNDLSELLLSLGIDPVIFKSEIEKINIMRKTIYPESRCSKAEMFQYFMELEHISMRFSANNLSNLNFTW